MNPKNITILLLCIFCTFSRLTTASSVNVTLPHQHPDPEAVVQDVHRRVNASLARRQLVSVSKCLTGNPIDDCWRCDPSGASKRRRLAECAIGFGRDTLGGKLGSLYLVTDSSDNDPAKPTPGTLRHAAIQEEPLWIIFTANMLITLRHELVINSYKTIDGRGSNIHITGNGCLTIQNVTHVIVHNIHIHDCKPSGNTWIATSPTIVQYREISDGDAITIRSAQKIWIDHCSLSSCADGLIDVTLGSTAVTLSNNYFSHHEKVMLLGHDDQYELDKGMQVTVAFNHFAEKLVMRMPRVRHGYAHVVNNDYTEWEMYAIGGSANPTIYSQGNRFSAPADPNVKQVTMRMDADGSEWKNWNWRSIGDIMVNGAYFVQSGDWLSASYAKAWSVEPKPAAFIDQLTENAGVFVSSRRGSSISLSDGGVADGTDSPGSSFSIETGNVGNEDADYFEMTFSSGARVGSAVSAVLLASSFIISLYLSLILI